MNDFEIVKACADAMGYPSMDIIFSEILGHRMCVIGDKLTEYDPLNDDEQSHKIAEKFNINLKIGNRAICEYAALANAGKEGT